MIDRDYLSFDELMVRWNYEGRDIHYLIASGKLVPSIVWANAAICCEWEADTKNGDGFYLRTSRDEGGVAPLVVQLTGWVYLGLPTLHGAYDKYSFSYATSCPIPLAEEFSRGVWYRLIESWDDRSTAHVSAQMVEEDAVFMKDMVEQCELPLESSVRDGKMPASTAGANVQNDLGTVINSSTHDRLRRAIGHFSAHYPAYATRPPKLDTDIRPWLLTSKLALNQREAHVFGVILVEHFKLSPDTQRPKQ